MIAFVVITGIMGMLYVAYLLYIATLIKNNAPGVKIVMMDFACYELYKILFRFYLIYAVIYWLYRFVCWMI
jgi:hypothetical protein